MFTTFRKVFTGITVVNEGVDVAVGNGKYRTASTAIPTIGPTLWDEFFTAKAVRAISAFSGNDFNGGFVDEFHRAMVP